MTDRTSTGVRVQIGGFCIKGGGHLWTYEEGADGCSGWDVFVEIDPEDLHLFPEWIQEHYRYATEELEGSGPAALRRPLASQMSEGEPEGNEGWRVGPGDVA